jgi:hypothetical protein
MRPLLLSEPRDHLNAALATCISQSRLRYYRVGRSLEAGAALLAGEPSEHSPLKKLCSISRRFDGSTIAISPCSPSRSSVTGSFVGHPGDYLGKTVDVAAISE